MELRSLAHRIGLLLCVFAVTRGIMSLAVLALARFISVEDFGYVVLSRNILEFAYVLLNLGLPFAFLRFFAEYRDRAPVLYCTTGLAILALNVAGAAAVIVFRYPIARVLGMPPLFAHYLAPVAGAFAFQAFGQLLLLDYQARENFNGYLRVQLWMAACTLVAMTLLGAWRRSGEAAIIGLLAGNAIAVGLLLAHLGWERIRGGSFEAKLVGRMLRFGVPLVFTNVAFWIISFSDRFILGYFHGIREVSIYAVPSLLGSMVVMVFTMPVNSALAPQVYRLNEAGREDEISVLLRTVNKLLLLFVPPAMVLLVVAAPSLLALLGRTEYMEGLKALPVLCAGLGFFILYTIPNVILSQHHRTKAIGVVFLISGAVNVGMNAVLVPRLGFVGCAWSALATYCVIYGATSWLAEQYCPLGTANRVLLPAWAALFFFTGRIQNMHLANIWVGLLCLVLLVLYICVFVATRSLRGTELRMLWSSLRNAA